MEAESDLSDLAKAIALSREAQNAYVQNQTQLSAVRESNEDGLADKAGGDSNIDPKADNEAGKLFNVQAEQMV